MNRSLVRIFLGALVALFLVPLAALPAHAADAYVISGKITGTDSTGAVVPIAGAEVDAMGDGDNSDGWASTTTAADGSYTLTSADGLDSAGPWTIEAQCGDPDAAACYDSAPTHYGSEDDPTDITVTSGAASTVDVALQHWATISGTVEDANGAPVTTALDWNVYEDGGYNEVTGPDAQGHFTIDHIKPGDGIGFDVSDSTGNAGSAEVDDLTLSSGQTLTKNVTLLPYVLTGTVTGTDDNGNVVPLSGISLWVDDYQSGGDDGFWTYTGDDGTYRATATDGFNGVGPWEVEAFCEDGDPCYDTYGDVYAPTSFGSNGSPKQVSAASDGPTTVDLQIQRWGTISGTITDAAGNPVTTSLDWSGMYDGAGEDTEQISGPDDQGHYTITHVRPGDDLTFSVSDPAHDYGHVTISPYTVAQGPTVTTQNITLNPYSTVTAKAVDPDGNPVPYVRGYYYWQDPGGDWTGSDFGPLVSDKNGNFLIADTKIGDNYKICLFDDVYGVVPEQDSVRWAPSVRHQSMCDGNVTDSDDATVLTPTAADPKITTTVTMPVAGKGLDPADPWVTGGTDVGDTLTVNPGVWGPGDVSVGIQWEYYDDDTHEDVPISGATSTTYTPTADMAGEQVDVAVTGTKDGYVPVTRTASAGIIGASQPAQSGDLTITGSTAIGSTLTASYDDEDASVYYSWALNGARIPGATDDTLTITPAMAGSTISARVSVLDRSTNELDLESSVVADGVTAGTATITGTPTVGQTLTAKTTGWHPSNVTLTYQWQADGKDITGATGATYALTGDQAGKAITVTVTGTRSADVSGSATSAATTKVANAISTAGTVTITGTTQVGETLTATPSGWDPNATLGYQWQADGKDITGATNPTYTPTTDQAGQTLTVTITATRNGYDPVSATSDPTTKIANATSTAGTVTITGTTQVGETLTATPSGWDPNATLGYQWQADGKDITGATNPAYTPTTDQAGQTLTVTITATRNGYDPVSATSDPTTKIANATSTAGTVTITGTTQVGETLTATPSGWDPNATLGYQWQADGKDITGATNPTYTPTTDQAGQTLTVTITATRNGYDPVSATSDPTTKIANAPSTTPPTDTTPPPSTKPSSPTKPAAPAAPATSTAKPLHVTVTVKGKVRVGTKAKVKLAGVPAGAKVTYQWLRNGKKIKHATKAGYKPKAKDKGKKLSVRVTITVDGKSTVVTSKAKKTKKAKKKGRHGRLAIPGSETAVRGGRVLIL